MKKNFLLLFLMCSGIVYGQISISHSDFQDAFNPGATFYTYITSGGSAVSVFVGEPSSSAQYWDFSNYTYEYVGISVAITPSTAPLISEFPTANQVLYERTWELGPDTTYNWSYKELQTDKQYLLGLSDNTSVLLKYDPPVIHSAVPMEIGSTWIRKRDSTSLGSGYYVINQITVTVDAFGTMKLPSGEYECLRQKADIMDYAHTPVGDDTTWSRNYHFYSKNIREVNILGIQPDQFNLTDVEVNGFKYSDRQGNVGISEKSIPELSQNVPNPCSSQTVIQYTLAVSNDVILKVFDFLGKEISTLVNEKQSAGSHEIFFDCRGMSPGVYYYQLTSGDNSVTKKMLISR